jgi:hypothetical protein
MILLNMIVTHIAPKIYSVCVDRKSYKSTEILKNLQQLELFSFTSSLAEIGTIIKSCNCKKLFLFNL